MLWAVVGSSESSLLFWNWLFCATVSCSGLLCSVPDCSGLSHLF
jgi:hypothetical protein